MENKEAEQMVEEIMMLPPNDQSKETGNTNMTDNDTDEYVKKSATDKITEMMPDKQFDQGSKNETTGNTCEKQSENGEEDKLTEKISVKQFADEQTENNTEDRMTEKIATKEFADVKFEHGEEDKVTQKISVKQFANEQKENNTEDKMMENKNESVEDKLTEKLPEKESGEDKIINETPEHKEPKQAHLELSEYDDEQNKSEDEYSSPSDGVDNEETISDEEAMEQDIDPEEELKLLYEDSEMTHMDHIYYCKHSRPSSYRNALPLKKSVSRTTPISQTGTSLDNTSTSNTQKCKEAANSSNEPIPSLFVLPTSEAQPKLCVKERPNIDAPSDEALPSSTSDLILPKYSSNGKSHSTPARLSQASIYDVQPCSSSMDLTTVTESTPLNSPEDCDIIDLCDDTPPSSPKTSSDCEILGEVKRGSDSDLKKFYLRYFKTDHEEMQQAESDDDDYEPIPKMHRASGFQLASGSTISNTGNVQKSTCRLSDMDLETYLSEAEEIIKRHAYNADTDDDNHDANQDDGNHENDTSSQDTSDPDTYNPMALHCLSKCKYDARSALIMLKRALEDLNASYKMQNELLKQDKEKDDYDKPNEGPNKEPNE